MNSRMLSSSKSDQLPVRTAPSPLGRRVGRLVIVGSGIRAIGQFTLEARAHIRQADRVYHVVADPATERWIQEQNPEIK
jgi:hypothetical protein